MRGGCAIVSTRRFLNRDASSSNAAITSPTSSIPVINNRGEKGAGESFPLLFSNMGENNKPLLHVTLAVLIA